MLLNFLLGYFVLTIPLIMWIIFKILVMLYEHGLQNKK